MTNHPASADRLQPLLSAMLDGQLTDGQIAELRRLLRTDPAARRQYVRQVNTHVMLQWINAPPDADGGQPAVSSGQWTAERQEVQGSGFRVYEDRQSQSAIFHPSHHSRFVPHSPLSTLHSPLFRRRLSVLVHGGGADSGDRLADRLDVENLTTINKSSKTRAAASSGEPGVPGDAVGRPDHRHGRLPVGRSDDRSLRARRRPPGPQVRPGLRPHGNHLRHRGQGHPARPGHV